jgi:uncharacterized membrane protein YccC
VSARLRIHTRMALQMLAALALAFAIGMPLFHDRWSWVVLSAFIVCSGAVGRDDAVRKGVQRVAGAICGTLLSATFVQVAIPGGDYGYAAVVFAVLFIGMWLREWNYACWAACSTMIFALLQGSQGAAPLPLFGERVLCIVIGALCAIASVSFVFPISREALERRRRKR